MFERECGDQAVDDRDFLALAQVEPALLVYPGRPH
jgi:hypothetical protein